MKKKLLKIAAGALLFLLLLLIGIPLFLEAKIGPIIRNNVNNNITGHFDFDNADLSLLRSFPNARVSLSGIRLTTPAPFDGDTLLKADEAYLVIGLRELFKGEGEPIALRELMIEGADLHLAIDSLENANYDLARDSGASDGAEEASEGFTFDLQSYAIHASRVRYSDASSGISLELDEIEHSGSGDLSAATSELQTRSKALISLSMDSVAYLNRNPLELDALLGIDLETDTYTFKENEGRINQMPLVFNGSVQLLEEGQQVDLHFKTPTSDFVNFLALIPEAYSKNLEGVTTNGTFNLEGDITGISNDDRIPDLDIRMEASDASFRYPGLPKGMDDINFSARVRNTTGNTDDTYLEVPRASFRIDQDAFDMQATIRSLTGNPKVEAAVKGTLNLANLKQAYPVDVDGQLSGTLLADITTAFDMESVEKERYENTRTSGTLQVRNLVMENDAFGQPVKLQEANLRFDPAQARLESLSGTMGSSDFKVSGTFRNYLAYLLSDGTLQGDLNLQSDRLVVEDFQSAPSQPAADESGDQGAAGEPPLQLPANLAFKVNANAGTVIYDGMPMNNVTGSLDLRDQEIRLQQVKSNALKGLLSLDGSLSTRKGAPRFRMDLGIDGVQIRETLEAIELLETLAPIASILDGKLNSKVSLGGLLKEDFSPDLMSLAGNVVAEVLASEPSGRKAQVMQALDTRLDFIDFSEIDLKGLKTILAFEDGVVAVRPFSFNYKDIGIAVEGGHTFDQQLDYQVTLQVPAKYLGSEVSRLLTELQEPGLAEATIPVIARVGGKYSDPSVQTDLKAAITDLTGQLVEAQKQKLLASGQEKAQSLIGDILSGKKDSTKTAADTTRTSLGGVLQQVTGLKKPDSTSTRTDTTRQAETTVKKAAKNLLGGLLNRKKDTATARDSVQ